MQLSVKTRKKGYEIFKKKRIQKSLETKRRIHFNVLGETSVHYVIYDKLKNVFTCDCQYFSLHQKPCSHIYAAYLLLKSTKKER